jgi:acyl dehydratase
MPLDARKVGSSPPQSPLETEVILPWAMNFAASFDDMHPAYFDNTDGKVPIVHPLFLSACVEITGAWAALYVSGATKEEVIEHTFVHFSYDAVFHRPIQSGEALTTEVQLVGLGNRPSGAHFVTRMHTADTGGAPVCTSHWGGIVLGLPTQAGLEDYSSFEQPAPPPPRPAVGAKGPPAEEVTEESARLLLAAPASAAHVWDACIRNPRQPKPRSSDINTHTNLLFAQKAGLGSRTLNGLYVLALSLSRVLGHVGAAAGSVSRVGCTFKAPVFLSEGDPVRLELRLTSYTTATRGRAGVVGVAFFDVLTPGGGFAVKGGFVQWGGHGPPAKL